MAAERRFHHQVVCRRRQASSSRRTYLSQMHAAQPRIACAPSLIFLTKSRHPVEASVSESSGISRDQRYNAARRMADRIGVLKGIEATLGTCPCLITAPRVA